MQGNPGMPYDETSAGPADPPMPVIGQPAPPVEDGPGMPPAPAVPAAAGPTGVAVPASAYPQPLPEGARATPLPSVAMFSSTKRQGRWVVPETISVTRAFSDVKLDLREAVVTTPVVTVKVLDAFSTVKIVVPPGVGVDVSGGVALFSEDACQADGVAAPGAYRLQVSHFGMFSTVKVVQLAPGETEPKWWHKLG